MSSARSIFKGFLTLNLISIPIKVFAAARPEGAPSFNLLHGKCKSRIKMPKHCPVCDVDVESSELIKGYEVGDGRFLTFTEEELAECKPDSSKTIEITSCVKSSELDPLLFESSYYLEPEAAGSDGYALIHQALAALNYFAIGKITIANRENVIVIRPLADGALAFHSMFYKNEVRDAPSVENKTVSKENLALAKQLLTNSLEDFNHASYRDTYAEAVTALIASKQANAPVKTKPVKKPAASVDLMTALKASISAGKKGKKVA